MNIKPLLGATIACAITLIYTNISEAALIDRGGGLIYDDALNITWLQDANYTMINGEDVDESMNWYEDTTWAAREGYVIPIPLAVWLFGSGLFGLIGLARGKA